MLPHGATGNGDGGLFGLARIKLQDMVPEDGAASGVYNRAVEKLSISLARNNAAIIELNSEDAALVRCALESAKLYFRSRSHTASTWNSSDWLKLSGYLAAPARDMYFYRAGRTLEGEETEPPPPCMPEVFRCLGKASRASLSGIARHLRLRGDAFGQLLDDSPLGTGEISSSVLTATAFHATGPGEKGTTVMRDSGVSQEVEKGLLLLIASDTPGLQVLDPSGRWYLADNVMGPGDLLLLTGRTLEHASAGIRRACVYRVVPVTPTAANSSLGRTSLAFRLMPRMSATIDCMAVAGAGHIVPDGYGPIPVQSFLNNVIASENSILNGSGLNIEPLASNAEPSLRSSLSDPLTGALLEDAMASFCGHSYGGGTLQRVYDTMQCTVCGAAVEGISMVHNLALRAAAAAFKRTNEERTSLLHSGSLRLSKRKREIGEQVDSTRMTRSDKELPKSPEKDVSPRTGSQAKGVQYPFSVNEKVLIKGNKRTPEKFVGRDACITSQCLNGWYLVRLLDSGESVRLQYRSLARATGEQNGDVGDDAQVPAVRS
ncbi:hypothetical protein M758_9G172900 [Ceratodon purpureus]|uniref:PUB 62/63 C-terminal domain-containing protein n=1 Tax=Ceratodon purpureus TaxID=3225 RepID=A0A8T0GT22_CERPU|nr:hypothetical protein KC19_9G116800 [Ceratodon purpureus]KAG0606848.1 hypothetical protein M758_9G172900 [Ceratodon purpureus]